MSGKDSQESTQAIVCCKTMQKTLGKHVIISIDYEKNWLEIHIRTPIDPNCELISHVCRFKEPLQWHENVQMVQPYNKLTSDVDVLERVIRFWGPVIRVTGSCWMKDRRQFYNVSCAVSWDLFTWVCVGGRDMAMTACSKYEVSCINANDWGGPSNAPGHTAMKLTFIFGDIHSFLWVSFIKTNVA